MTVRELYERLKLEVENGNGEYPVCVHFEEKYPSEKRTFGDCTDVDTDNKIGRIVLFGEE